MKGVYEWGIPAAGFLTWMVLTFIIVPVFMRYLRKRGDQTQRLFDKILSSVLGTPLILFILVLGLKLFLNAIPPVPAKWDKYIDAAVLVLFALTIYLFIDKLMIEVLRRYRKKLEMITSSEGVVKAIYRSVILIFILLVILDSLKITITPFIASLGIGGVVVGLAMQDTLSNLFSWAYIISNKPIRVGDYIEFEAGKEGYVDRIGWRNVRIRMLSNNTLIVPNNKLVSSPVTNFYLPETELAVLVNVGVAYQSDLEKVEKVTIEVAKEVLHETEGAVREFQPFIRYNAFGESSIKFTVILRAKEYTNQYLIIHEFIKRLHRRYQLEGIEIPFPTRTVYMKDGTSTQERS
jgi:small-conductance mechanosensitive channel